MKIIRINIQFIINAENKTLAEKILNGALSKITEEKKSLSKLKKYEDDFHYEYSFSVELQAKDLSNLKYKAFKLCICISNGPWLYLHLPDAGGEFKFEAIFNHEAFIHHSPEFENKLKWAHLETD